MHEVAPLRPRFTHISARAPGAEHHFLINPYGLLFEEVTASSLVKVDLHGRKVMESPFDVNPAGFVIHSAIHAAREDAICVLHLHTPAGVAVACQKDGLLPISQQSLFVLASLSAHDYEGVALNEAEKPRLVADLGKNTFLILPNHGLLTVGRSIADAFLAMYTLERACEIQVKAQAGGGGVDPDPEADPRRRRRPGGAGDARPRRPARLAGAAAQDGPVGPRLPVLNGRDQPWTKRPKRRSRFIARTVGVRRGEEKDEGSRGPERGPNSR